MKTRLAALALLTLGACSPMMTTDAGPPPCTPGTTSLDEIFATTLGPASTAKCVQCHGVGAGQGGVFFTDAKSFYDVMVGVTSKADPSTQRVNPGHPESSHLFFRIQPNTDVLKRMPQGGAPLTAAQVDAIGGWICAGAPRPTGVFDAGVDAGTDAGADGGTDAGIDAGVLALTSFSPQAGVVGTHVTLTGEGFSLTAANDVVTFSGNATATVTTATATSLEVDVPASATTGPITVTVGGRSATSASSFTVVPGTPVPTLSSLTPNQVGVGAGDTTLVLSGGSFRQDSVAKIDGVPVATTFVASARLDAVAPAALFAQAGTHNVTVTTTAPDGGAGGGTSSAVVLTVTNPAPVLSAITPTTVATGGAAFSLSLTGTGFVAGSTVELDGSAVATTFGSSTALTAQMPSFSAAATHNVAVRNPAPGGGVSSAQVLTVVMTPLPSISNLSPNPASSGAAFTLTITGANFTCAGAGPVVLFNSAQLTPSACTATSLTVAAPSTPAGAYDVVVKNPNNDQSAPFTLNVVTPNPLPVATSLTPSTVNAGSGAQTLQVNGSQFVSSSVVNVNGVARSTTFVDAGVLTAALLAGDVASAGTKTVTVTTPAPGGGTSAGLTLTVQFVNPVPALSALAPSLVVTNSGATDVVLTGTGFVAASQGTFDGANRVTTFNSPTQVTVSLTAADAMAAGTHSLVVTNPAPGGGASNGLSLVVGNPVPSVSTLSPCGKVAGAAQFTLTLNGTNFLAGSTVSFGGTSVPTTFVSSTQLTATIAAGLVATAPSDHAIAVVVTNPSPGGGPSSAFTFGLAGQARTLADVQTTFTTVCAASCHSALGQSGGLVLEAGVARGNLVGVASNCSGQLRVRACGALPADSLLIDKLHAGQTATFPACGGPMPAIGSITPTEYETIVDWVAQGAPP